MKSTVDYSEFLVYERAARERGHRTVAGVDEVGRGPLAGPLVVCAVVLDEAATLPDGISDSKCLTPTRRETLFEALQSNPAVEAAFSVVTPEEIDRLNILRATHVGMYRALARLRDCDFALVDGLPVPGLPVPSRAIVKGDSRSVSIGAASVLAKVYRDRCMEDYENTYPGYGFARHKGYPTREHLDALRALGVSPIHRRSFGPVARLLNPQPRYVQTEFDFGGESALPERDRHQVD